MSMLQPYNHEADCDPITQETEIITPELADRISARIALQEPTPVELLWTGLEQKAKQTQRWKTDARGARKAQRIQRRADHLHATYLAACGKPGETAASDELEAFWSDFEEKQDQANELWEQHETLVRNRTLQLRLKGVGVLAGAALATHYIGVPMRLCVVGYGTIGLSVTALLVARSLYAQGSAHYRKARKPQQHTAPAAPSKARHLEVVSDLPFQDESDDEPFDDRYQLLQDMFTTRHDGETGAFTGLILQRLQDNEQFGELYADLDPKTLKKRLKDDFRIKPMKVRMGDDTAAGFYYETQINAALRKAGVA